ncbi:thiopurine S-methyltransferase [Aeromonas caviae]|uniref:thiopurine S-methyltransferase n=1 Tax=Aeromonas TaxID=642 RepID=UPI00191CA5FC|nr:thiopurine S-methyltransferase [Aeromonas caviae]MBL0548833.1 thiopurine S-methyltransferase [Aeromonas caviae]MDH0240910.1 thiopurine S-methyltransferase [Aeromonas caviae]MDH0351237.1 thiopurine S-methyltransferase [Aeromonas caviae]
MEAAFWHQKWKENRIGFHQADFNRWLQSWWSAQQGSDPVLVPLCGKSRDMLWLREQGHPVDGFELSELAITQFFDDNNLSAEKSEVGPYQCHRHADLRIYQGDFFVAPELGQRYRLVYDRAALIALPGAMRRQYAALMSRLVEAGGQVLLVTLEYQPEQQQQPPFSVGEMEVRTLFERDFGVEVLGRGAELDHPRVLSGQLSYFDEVAYRLIRRG